MRTMQTIVDEVADLAIEIGMPLGRVERDIRLCLLRRVLEHTKGNQCKAAALYGKHRNTISRDVAEMRSRKLLHGIKAPWAKNLRKPVRSVGFTSDIRQARK